MTTLHGCTVEKDKRTGGYRVITPDRSASLGMITRHHIAAYISDGWAAIPAWQPADSPLAYVRATRIRAAEALIEAAIEAGIWRPDFGPETETELDREMREVPRG